MALTPSRMLPLGTQAFAFNLIDARTQKNVALKDFEKSQALLVMFICNHCPYVKHLKKPLAELIRSFEGRGLGTVAINSNDAENYPEDDLKHMTEEVRVFDYPFAYLFDESQEVAKAYQAACTPDFYVFDKNQKLVYRGQFDESRPGDGKAITGQDLRKAIEAALVGAPQDTNQKPSMGCNIKWKA